MAPTFGYPAASDSLREASRLGLALRRARVGWRKIRRLRDWVADPAAWVRPGVTGDRAAFPHLAYHREIAIRRTDPGADPVLDEGKAHNLALAAPRLDGLVLAPDAPLSFWRALGRCTPARGFRPGAEVRAGCVVPTVGGGLCLLSNALFAAACELGWTILERHGHTAEVAPEPAAPAMVALGSPGSPASCAVALGSPGSPASCAVALGSPGSPGSSDRGAARVADAGRALPWGLDATVLWPHVDLRVAPREGAAWLRVRVTGQRRDTLEVRVFTAAPAGIRVELATAGDAVITDSRGDRRHNQIVRHVYDARTDRLIAREVVAYNRRRLLSPAAQRRSCNTCDELACHARPAALRRRTRPGVVSTNATNATNTPNAPPNAPNAPNAPPLARRQEPAA